MSVLINDLRLARIYSDIIAELDRSKVKHPVYPGDNLRRSMIVLEEFLESATCVCRAALQVGRVGNEEKYATIADLRKELVHLGAMCFKQLEAIDEERDA